MWLEPALPGETPPSMHRTPAPPISQARLLHTVPLPRGDVKGPHTPSSGFTIHTKWTHSKIYIVNYIFNLLFLHVYFCMLFPHHCTKFHLWYFSVDSTHSSFSFHASCSKKGSISDVGCRGTCCLYSKGLFRIQSRDCHSQHYGPFWPHNSFSWGMVLCIVGAYQHPVPLFTAHTLASLPLRTV